MDVRMHQSDHLRACNITEADFVGPLKIIKVSGLEIKQVQTSAPKSNLATYNPISSYWTFWRTQEGNKSIMYVKEEKQYIWIFKQACQSI